MRWLLALAGLLLLLSAAVPAAGYSPSRLLLDFVRNRVDSGSAKAWDLSLPADAPLIRQQGLKAADRIIGLPGQPKRSPVRQYAGYVTVDDKAGRHLFYYFSEVRRNSSNLPIILWINGGPGCSSVGAGAFLEHGPLLVGKGGKGVYKNHFSWHQVGHVIYLDSPVGSGFSYSDTPSDYQRHSDVSTAQDNLRFLVNWLERFPEYKHSNLYLAGEGYAGNYLPQLAQLILNYNSAANGNLINLKALILGNSVIDSDGDFWGFYDNLWSHGVILERIIDNVVSSCNATGQLTECSSARNAVDEILRPLYLFDLTADVCAKPTLSARLDVDELYECTEKDVAYYLSSPEVQKALHVNPDKAPKIWRQCNSQVADAYEDITISTLPIIKNLLANHIRFFVYSGDADAAVPAMSTRMSLKKLNLTVSAAWHGWFTSMIEQAGFTETYMEGLTFATVKGAGHMVPKTHASQLLTLIQLSRNGTLITQTSQL